MAKYHVMYVNHISYSEDEVNEGTIPESSLISQGIIKSDGT